jgi:hypothetical protein
VPFSQYRRTKAEKQKRGGFGSDCDIVNNDVVIAGLVYGFKP